MSAYKIVIADYYYPDIDLEKKIFERLGEGVELVDCTKIIPGGAKTPEQLIPFIKDADALIVQFASVTAEVIGQMEHCKVIARYAIGVDTIDVNAATEKNIFVANVPDYCIDEVADTACAHILNAMRKITWSRDRVLDGTFSMDSIQSMKRLGESTLCLLGFGNIARNVAKKMNPFYKRIVAFDPFFTNQAAYPEITFLSIEEALAEADTISIHVPLNNSTRNLLSTKEFELMQDGVVIVNTARGGIIDEQALMMAIDSGKVGYCGLDVISTEDFANAPLLKHPSLTITPHIGWCSADSVPELQRKTAENVVATLLEGRPPYSVNLGE